MASQTSTNSFEKKNNVSPDYFLKNIFTYLVFNNKRVLDTKDLFQTFTASGIIENSIVSILWFGMYV